MRRYLGLVLACVLAAISFSALAMGLGEIRLNSYLNQRLDAEIELVSAAADEIESLKITLADDAVYQRYGLQRTAVLNSVRFDVVRRPNGTAYIRVTSTEPIREPFLTLFVVADWSRGRLMREYTLLIDPPAFASRKEPTPQPQAPAIETAPAPLETEPFVEQPAPVTEQVEPAEQVTGDLISIPPLEADAMPPADREPRYTEPAMGGDYGPVQRNETLWGIARRLRPDESVTINQMMLALYRANPEAFQGNINRLKAGYILRIPDYRDITSMSSREAFVEVKRQNEDWRAARAAPAPAPAPSTPVEVEVEPELTLVAPEEDLAPEIGTGVGAGGEADDLGMGAEESIDPATEDVEEDAVDLGVEDDTQDRLLDIEDESMQALQEQETPLPEEGAVEEGLAEEGGAEETEAVEPPPLPLPGEPGEAADDAPATETAEETAVPEEETAVEGDTQAEPPTAAPAPVRVAEPSLVEKVRAFAFSPLGMGIGAAILVLLLAGFLVMRKRREASQAAAATAAWGDDDNEDVTVISGADEDVTVVTGRDDGAKGDLAAVFGHGIEHEDTGTTRLSEEDAETRILDAEKTQMLSGDGGERPAGSDFVETIVGDQPVTLDENDPLSEADFHMAYGLYDQAAEVVQKAVERDPTRKDYLAKLAEIHFAGNNTEGFLDAARRLKELADPGDTDWENVAIMGHQIAPDDALFAGAGSATAVDLDFGAAAEEVEAGDAGTTASPSVPPDDSLDFDIDLGTGDTSAEPPAPPAEVASDDDDGLSFDLDAGLEETGTADDNAAPPAEDAAPAVADTGDSDFDFDLGELDEPAEDTAGAGSAEISGSSDEQTQTEFDKALEELSAFVDTNLPEQDAGDAVAESADSELNLDDYSFDEDASALAAESEGTGDDEEDIGEAGTKLDLARAYIDMGDPDGARGILEEVIADGDDDQQREARELLDQLA
ncbi:MAG TPA: FimV/HubP family polar landmark protein [Gammaproteobacteria bacterium]